MTSILDASALLSYLQREPGADLVEQALDEGAVVSAVNWSEVAQKITARGEEWALSATLLDSFGIRVEPVGRQDAERAATLWRAGSGLSLADRLCLALGQRLGAEVLSADSAWGEGNGIRQIR